MERKIFVYMDNNRLKAATGDLKLTGQTAPIEIEFELEIDGSVGDAGYSGWAFSNQAGASSTDQVTGYGATIQRASSNTSGESVANQFSVSLKNSNLTITDQNNDTSSSTNGAGTFVFSITVYGANNASVTTDPMIYNR